MKTIIIFFVFNFSLTFWLLGLLAALVHLLRLPRPWTQAVVVDVLLRWFLFFAVGTLYLYNAVVHTVFAEQSAKFIGWANSPFQYEVGFASLGFAVIGFIAARGVWQARLCAIVGPACFSLGAAGGHIYQMVAQGNFAPGNAGVVFYTDILLPVFGGVLLYLSRPSLSQQGAQVKA